MHCIGIDLGTTNSLVAVFDEGGSRLLPNALGEMMTPSVVGLADDKKTLLIGRAARARLVRYPDYTTARFKRLMGTGKKIWLGRKEYMPVELSAMVLKSLKDDAEAQLGNPVTEAVISVPAYFNSVQRQATKDAAEIAGLKVRSLVNEPTAAALAAGVLDREDESTFIVLDLGGGTFDVSILEMFDGVMEVRASSGDAYLGGEDFTARIAAHFASENGQEWDDLTPAERAALLAVADDIKQRLSTKDQASGQARIGGREVKFELDNTQFARLTEDLVARLRRPIETSLYDAQITADQVDRIILVGGATRMPVIRSLAARIFRKLPERSVDPDHAIALGAAIQAGLIARHEGLSDMVMTDVAPFSLGVSAIEEVNGRVVTDRFVPLIERNTILPASRSEYFCATSKRQTKINLEIYQGESAIASENVKLGELMVRVPRATDEPESVEVRFTYDTSGLLAVDAKVVSSGQSFGNVIENLAEAMPKEEKTRRLKAMEALKISPRDEAENITLMETLKHLYEILLGSDRKKVQELITEFEAVMDAQDPVVIKQAREHLTEIAKHIEQNYVR